MDVTKVAPKVDTLGLQQNITLLEQGRDIYINRCTKCHNAVRITRYPMKQWEDKILPEMIVESRLSPAQSKAVTAYVQAVLLSNQK
jgi:hypothetical protein